MANEVWGGDISILQIKRGSEYVQITNLCDNKAAS